MKKISLVLASALVLGSLSFAQSAQKAKSTPKVEKKASTKKTVKKVTVKKAVSTKTTTKKTK